ncbi:cytochrome P450 [Kitasatospora phosalacinea]|uniref:cytochrome P450 n=1 Tax=Kitasatospora phosalacinea TaxID=2065 RepID=UPI0036583331
MRQAPDPPEWERPRLAPGDIGPVPLEQVDLADPDHFTDGATHWRMLDTLRRDDPVHWQPEPAPGSGFWAVTRHADIVRVGRDSDTFSSARFVNLEEVTDDQIARRASMLELDGPRHLALRGLLRREFTAAAVRGHTDLLRDLATTTLDRAPSGSGPFDFVTEVAAPFPARVLARLLGLPPEGHRLLLDWGDRLLATASPRDRERHRDLPFNSPAALEVFAHGRALARERGGGLAARLVEGSPQDGVPLSGREFDNYFLLLVAAGHETTRHTLSHALLALAHHHEQYARLRRDPALLPLAVEEFLRRASPVHHFRRTATRDTHLGGRRIRAGDKVVMWYSSGNRDERVFADPYAFDVTRTPNPHLAFGRGGPHRCLGAALARAEIRVLFEELLARWSDVRPAGPVRWTRSNFIHGIRRLPVDVTPA